MTKQTPTATRKYLYDFENLLRESDGSDVLQKEYTSTAKLYGELVSAFGGGATSYLAADALGDAAALLNDSGSVTDTYRYRAFGLATHVTGTSSNEFTFVGRKGYQQDADVNLHYVKQRYYDFLTGQWVSEDPLGFKAGDALVLAIGTCPEIGDGPGRLVTAVFRHWQGETWDLQLDGEPVPIVVTREHPFWSADRTAWVPAWQLRPGERLSPADGPRRGCGAFRPANGPSRCTARPIERGQNGSRGFPRIRENHLLIDVDPSNQCHPCSIRFSFIILIGREWTFNSIYKQTKCSLS